MKTNDVIRELMYRNRIRFNQFAEMLGLKPNALASRMKRGNFSTDVLGEMLGQLGYKLVMVPKDEPIADGWFEVEPTDGDTPTPGLENESAD